MVAALRDWLSLIAIWAAAAAMFVKWVAVVIPKSWEASLKDGAETLWIWLSYQRSWPLIRILKGRLAFPIIAAGWSVLALGAFASAQIAENPRYAPIFLIFAAWPVVIFVLRRPQHKLIYAAFCIVSLIAMWYLRTPPEEGKADPFLTALIALSAMFIIQAGFLLYKRVFFGIVRHDKGWRIVIELFCSIFVVALAQYLTTEGVVSIISDYRDVYDQWNNASSHILAYLAYTFVTLFGMWFLGIVSIINGFLLVYVLLVYLVIGVFRLAQRVLYQIVDAKAGPLIGASAVLASAGAAAHSASAGCSNTGSFLHLLPALCG